MIYYGYITKNNRIKIIIILNKNIMWMGIYYKNIYI